MLNFIIGSCIASFCSCLAERLLINENLFTRSHCATCHHQLAWYNLIPIISYCLQNGLCPYCQTKIPKHLILVEIFGGLSLMLFAHQMMLLWLLFSFIFLSVQDYLTQTINIWLAWLTCLISLLQLNYHPQTAWLFWSLSTFCLSSLLFLFIKQQWLGSGDFPIILTLWFSLSLKDFSLCLMIASCCAILVLFFFKLKVIPLIPFLTLGYWLVNILPQVINPQ
ncbi:prepilin peptidase [Periweissella beninensis]|uniref:prepilin peptidase n=1 Tax=Periweissella beninensis TaxID=504936 RepID=UPI0021A6991D|nr:A24 family peptidase [Periweissella beninensis]MCT4395973.1 prepilin peptidase [Periweissella beninensis]